MKFFLWFFGIIAVAILIIVGLYYYNANADDFSRRMGESLQATSIDRNKNLPPTPVPTPVPVGPINYAQVINNTAIASGTRVTIVGGQGKTYQVELNWGGARSDLAGVFLDSLTKQNLLADFTEVQPLSARQDNRGQMQYVAQFRLEFK